MNLLSIILAVNLPFAPDYTPAPDVVLAIIEHESHGNPKLCKDELDGSSSWGLMQLNHKGTSCAEGKWTADFEPRRNISRGMWLLAFQAEWCHHTGHTHDPLIHYAGKGPAAERFAIQVRRLALQIRVKLCLQD